MALYQVTFWDGSVDEVEADDSRAAREAAEELNDCGIQRVVLVKSNPADDEDEAEDVEDCDEDEEDDDDDE